MNIALWILAGLLAVAFLGAGAMKLVTPRTTLTANPRMAWTAAFSEPTVKTIGLLEVLGGIGLVLPPMVRIAPFLAPLAATGLAITMIGAAFTHARRHESMLVPLVLLALCVLLAAGRFGVVPFS